MISADASAVSAGRPGTAEPNRAALAHRDRQERLRLFCLLVPALCMILVAVALPIAWMITLSFIGEHGGFTLENYRIFFTRGGYLSTVGTTFQVSLIVVIVTVLLGYPLTYVLASLPRRFAAIGTLAIMLPYLTSILVRTYAWLVVLGRHGIVNEALTGLGLIQSPLPLIFNTTGTVIGMVHVMVPLLVLPLYGSMKAIDPNLVRAAASLGATPIVGFWTVFFRLSLPGLMAGSFLVFVTCLGFFITPAVLGGGHVVMMAQQIATAVAVHNTFGVASALGVALLVSTIVVLLLARKIVRLDLRHV